VAWIVGTVQNISLEEGAPERPGFFIQEGSSPALALVFEECDFGRSGQAFVETDPTQADASTIVRNLLDGQYNRPVRVMALNVEEGWVRDVSQVIAAKVRDVARRDGQGLTGGTRGFIEAHSDPADQQQVLPLWQ
jgi:hypothetical protein